MPERKPGDTLSGHFDGPIATKGGEAVDARNSNHMIYKPGWVHIDRRFQILLSPITILLVFTIVAVVVVGFWIYQQPSKMNGDFNIVVAEFGQVTAEGLVSSAVGRHLSKQLFDFLDSEYDTTDFGLDVEVTHRNIGIVDEDRTARRLARRTNADVVIYGSVFELEDEARLLPRFYIVGQPDTGELTGQHNLAVPIDFDVSTLTSQDQVKYELQSRAAILVHFTEGMIYLSAENEKAAEIAFREAVQIAEQYRDFEGQEVLYLFLSVSQQLQRDYSEAHRALDHAFQINRDYARAYVARGNLYYSKAVVSEFDVELFELALYEYQEAASSPDQPAGAYIPVKSDISIGNVYVVLAQLTNDPELLVRARNHYEQAMALCGEAEDEALLDLRTVAVCSIGVAYEIEGNVDRADQVYDECLASSSAEEMRTIVKRRLRYLEGTLLPTPSNEVVVTPIDMLPDYVETTSPTPSPTPYIPPTRPCTSTPEPPTPYVPPTVGEYPEVTPAPEPTPDR